jgi:hypothetical protein
MSDPLFFAEEFAARRRRYILVNVNISKITSSPTDKNFRFPFITGVKSKGTDSYDDIFKLALDTRFTPFAPTFIPTTRFEAMANDFYFREAAGLGPGPFHLDNLRARFVQSLQETDAQIDLASVITPPSPINPSNFGISAVTGGPVFATAIPTSRAIYAQEVNFISVAETTKYFNNYHKYSAIGIIDLLFSQTQPITFLELFIALDIIDEYIKLLDEWKETAATLNNANYPTLKAKTDLLTKYHDTLSVLLQKQSGIANTFAIGAMAKEISKTILAVIATGWMSGKTLGINIFNLNLNLKAELVRLLPQYQPGMIPILSSKVAIGSNGKIQNVGQTANMTSTQFTAVASIDFMNIKKIFVDFPALFGPKGVNNIYGYLTPDFVNFLTSIATNPTSACNKVLFKDDASTPTAIFVDMWYFISCLLPSSWNKADQEFISRQSLGSILSLNCDPRPTAPYLKDFTDSINAHTIEEAFNSLRIMQGTALQRYLLFIRFIYIFFDHIPEARLVISALLSPLVAMLTLINPTLTDPLQLLEYDSKAKIEALPLFNSERIFNPKTSLQDAIRRSVELFKNLLPVRSSLALLLHSGQNPAASVSSLGPDPKFTTDALIQAYLFATPIKTKGKPDLDLAQKIYDKLTIKDFVFPTPSSSYRILLNMTGVIDADLFGRIFTLTGRWFEDEAAYNKYKSDINKNKNLAAEYKQLSSHRIAYTDNGVLSKPLHSDTMINVLPNAAGSFIEKWKPSGGAIKTVANSWEELLYPGLVSHIIIEADHVREIAKTFVAPCLQQPPFSIVFPTDNDLTGGYVLSQGFDLENDPDVMSAIFEFPADVVNVILPAGTTFGVQSNFIQDNFPGDPQAAASNAEYTMLRRGSSRDRDASHGKIKYQLVNALNIQAPVIGVGGTATLIAHSMKPIPSPIPVSSLFRRTGYVWTPIRDSPAGITFVSPSVGTLFFPAVQTDLFLSSLFDWKLQLYYLGVLEEFLRGRTILKDYADAIEKTLSTIDVKIRTSISTTGPARAKYITDNLILYAGFANVVNNIAGPTAPAELSGILKLPEIIESSDLASDTRRFYSTQAPIPPRGPISYDITIDDYLALLTARQKSLASLEEKPNAARQREADEKKEQIEADIKKMIDQSAKRLIDPYSVLINEVVTRALYA